MTSQKIGRYEVKAELGRGGMATVYRAYDPSFDREVAIKVLTREFLHDPQFRERFKVEIKTIAALEHPAIVPVHDAGEDDGVPYFVMRYMMGGSLTDQINKGRFSMEDVARIIERLASALAHAHKNGVVHRDLKPDNILFDNNGDPFISDFGVASFTSGPSNITGNAAVGTPAYMSPEQAKGDKVDHRSDIYGLGVVIFQMLSGKQPYEADTPMGVAVKHITDPVPEILKANPFLPQATDTVIKTAMAKNKDDRYSSITDLSHAFQEIIKGRDEDTLQDGVPITPSANKRSLMKRSLMIGSVGAVVALLCVVAAILLAGYIKNNILQPTAESTAVATEVIDATQVGGGFFTEEFNGNLDQWERFITHGKEYEFDLSVQDGLMLFDLQGKDLNAYSYYKPQTYGDVLIEIKADNRGNANNSFSVICRYNEDAGWYEFNTTNNGLYKILYRKWDNDKKGASYVIIADGATTRIKAGNDVNDYVVGCEGVTLSLSINGSDIRTVDDNRFALTDGYIGIGAQSFNNSPVQIGVDSFAVSQP